MPKMRSLLWIMHANVYWTDAKLAAFTSISPVSPQYGQYTEAMAHTLIDCQSVRLFWVNVLSFILCQIDPILDADVIFQFRLSTNAHTHRPTKPVSLALVCGVWVLYCAHICHVHTDVLPSVRSLTAGYCSMVRNF
jgi:hypothetical protein